jgi:pimeloyl-ACP methyl ester carboxylesterase
VRAADGDMRNCPEGIKSFLRAYYHYKSADWKGNLPHPLVSWDAAELAKMPAYYIMELDRGMPRTVAAHAPSAAEIAACAWLPDEELRVYCDEFARTSFQGALQWYRNVTDPAGAARLAQSACGQFRGAHFIEGAGHWVQQEQPAAVSELLIEFLRER